MLLLKLDMIGWYLLNAIAWIFRGPWWRWCWWGRKDLSMVGQVKKFGSWRHLAILGFHNNRQTGVLGWLALSSLTLLIFWILNDHDHDIRLAKLRPPPSRHCPLAHHTLVFITYHIRLNCWSEPTVLLKEASCRRTTAAISSDPQHYNSGEAYELSRCH